MSRDPAQTRDEILVAARKLLEERDYHGVGLEDIGRAAGVSRQAVYLHFGSKAGLLLALVDWVDRQENLAERIAWVRGARDPVEALERFVEVAITYQPRIHRIARVLESARRTDEGAAAAWNDRMAARRRGIQQIVAGLASAGRLDHNWTARRAVDWLFTLTSVQVFENLTVDCGWSPAVAIKQLVRAAVETLVART